MNEKERQKRLTEVFALLAKRAKETIPTEENNQKIIYNVANKDKQSVLSMHHQKSINQ